MNGFLKNIKSSTLNSLLLSTYMLLCVGTQLKSLGILGGVFYYLLLIIPLFQIHLILSKRRLCFYCLVVFIGACLLCGIKGFFNSNLLFIIIAPIMANWIINNRFNLIILYFTYSLVILYFFNVSINDMNDEIMYTSRNYISVILLFHSVLLTIIVYMQTQMTLLTPSFLTLILSVMATGRGGILCSAIFFISMTMLKFHSIGNRYFKYALLISFTITIVSCIPSIEDYYEDSEYLFRVRNGGFEDYSREKLLKEYVTNIDAISFFTGCDMSKNAVFRQFEGNPHNSYIRLHSYLGFFMIIPIVSIIVSLFLHIKSQEFVFVLPLFPILLRGYTDIFFIGIYDFVIMVFIIHAFQKKVVCGSRV